MAIEQSDTRGPFRAWGAGGPRRQGRVEIRVSAKQPVGCPSAEDKGTEGDACRWRVASASVRGSSHDKMGLPCQDANRWEHLCDSLLVFAVADGAGTAPHGDLGASLAATSAVDAVRAALMEGSGPHDEEEARSVLRVATRAAREAVHTAAAEREVPPSDLATTLLVGLASPHLIGASQIGDGAIVIGDEGGHYRALTTPQKGEYANETVFLTSSGALEVSQMEVWEGALRHVAAFTDGLERLVLVMPDCSPYRPFFEPMFGFVAEEEDQSRAAEALGQYLHHENVRRRTDDDVTLLLGALL